MKTRLERGPWRRGQITGLLTCPQHTPLTFAESGGWALPPLMSKGRTNQTRGWTKGRGYSGTGRSGQCVGAGCRFPSRSDPSSCAGTGQNLELQPRPQLVASLLLSGACPRSLNLVRSSAITNIMVRSFKCTTRDTRAVSCLEEWTRLAISLWSRRRAGKERTFEFLTCS